MPHLAQRFRISAPTHPVRHTPSGFVQGHILNFHFFLTKPTRCTLPLTHSLTPRCRVLPEQLTGLQVVKKFPAFHGTPRFITALTSVRHLSLPWASTVQSIYPHPTPCRSILILSTHLRLGLPIGLFGSGFPTKTPYTPSPHPYASHAQPISCALLLSIFISNFCTCFRQLCDHHQDNLLYLCDTGIYKLCMGGCLVSSQPTDQTATHPE